MPYRFSRGAKLRISAALAASAPKYVLPADAVKSLCACTGLTDAQIKKYAENFRKRVNAASREHHLKAPALNPLNPDETEKPHPTRFSNAVLQQLMHALKNDGGWRFSDATVLVLMRTTRLSADSIRMWADRHRKRKGKVHFADDTPRKAKRRERYAKMRRLLEEDAAENLRVCAEADEMRRLTDAAAHAAPYVSHMQVDPV